MASFDDVKYTSINYTPTDFIEVALTHVVDWDGSEERIYVKRGELDDGRSYHGNLAIPFDQQVAEKVAAAILRIAGVDEFDYQETLSELEFLDG